MEEYKSKFNTCVGPSMYPTLKSGDGLLLDKFEDYRNNVHIGDIIIYPHPEKPFDVVHRIIKLTPEGVITRGDNNSDIDPYVILYEDIKGIVNAVKRRNKTISCAGGKCGYLIHKLMLIRKYTFPYLVYIPSRISRFTAGTGVFNFIHSKLDLKIIHIKRNGVDARLLYLKNKTVGKYLEDSNQWQIKFPYKLIINKKKL